ncbi:MAG: hypothetical protein ACKO34_04500 [Vampirovibrionales bacterium]
MQLPFITNSQLGFANLTNQLGLPNVNTRTAAASFIDLPGMYYLSSGDVSMRPLLSNDPYEISSPLIPGLSLSSFTPNGFQNGPPLFAQGGPFSLVNNQGFPISQFQTPQQQPSLGMSPDPFGLGLVSPTAMMGLGNPQGGSLPFTTGGLGQVSGGMSNPTALVGAMVQAMLPALLQQIMSSQGQFSQQAQFGMAPVGGAIFPQASTPQSMFGYQQPRNPYLTGMPSVRY